MSIRLVKSVVLFEELPAIFLFKIIFLTLTSLIFKSFSTSK
ncbi:uncharacterized protein METZ01_LOCUS382621 [marine metagenome]|uniref:Uncharacterized protein n=1 Tax=marine metagenome TaxID=408172 RepID=A0A382U725_9ZZZZ